MRITGGKYRSRLVECPKGEIRPAMDRMRVSFFSILGNDLSNMTVLDLFSGSGLISIEAASRGANEIDLVEKDFGKKPVILKNLSMISEKYNLFIMDARRFIKKFNGRKQYDLIYIDPPFKMEGKAGIVKSIFQTSLLKESGILAIHYPEEDEQYFEALDDETEKKADKRNFGRSKLRIYGILKTEEDNV